LFVTVFNIDGVITAYLLNVHYMLEVPTYQKVCPIDGCQCYVQTVYAMFHYPKLRFFLVMIVIFLASSIEKKIS